MSQRSEVRQYFSEREGGELWHRDFELSPLASTASKFESYVASSYTDPVLLDVGCGPGEVASCMGICSQGNVDILGIDISDDMVRRTAEEAGAEGIAADAAYIPLGDETVSGVWSTRALHFLQPQEQLEALREFERVLESGGQAVLEFKTREPGEEKRPEGYHLEEYVVSPETACGFVEEAGLNVSHDQPNGYYHHLVEAEK